MLIRGLISDVFFRLADAILANSVTPFLQSLATPSDVSKDFTNSFIGITIERFILYPPRNFSDEVKAKLVYAANLRYQTLGVDLPFEVASALQMFNFVNPKFTLIRQLHSKGPRATSSTDAVNEVVATAGPDCWGEEHIAAALLFLVLSQYWREFSIETYLAAVQSHYGDKQINWALTFRNFDRDGLRLDVRQFAKLYAVLLPLAAEDSTLDIQKLWGGDWEHRETQMSFLTAFIVSRTDASQIPNLRATFPS